MQPNSVDLLTDYFSFLPFTSVLHNSWSEKVSGHISLTSTSGADQLK